LIGALGNVLAAVAVLIAMPLFFAGFLVVPLIVLVAGVAFLALSAPG
jgi:hypothetical protein